MIFIVAKMQVLPQVLAEAPEIVNVEIPDGWSRMSEVQVDASGS